MGSFNGYALLPVFVLASVCAGLGEAVSLLPIGGQIVVKNGTALDIICSGDKDVILKHFIQKVTLDQNDAGWKCPGNCNLNIDSGAQGTKYTLSIKDVQVDHQGQYVCESTQNQSDQKKIMVYVASIIPHNGTLVDESEPVTISCDMTELNGVSVQFARDGKILETDEHYNFSPINQSLTFLKPTRKDVGPYECIFTNDLIKSTGKESINGTVFLLGGPFVDKFERPSKNLVEEDSTVINCKVFGKPLPSITWWKDGVKLTVNGTFNFTAYQGVPNATLVMKDLKQHHRGDYTCVADIGGISANATLLIRVKDKYAALWPFLGIVAEVVIVCAIIFIYEKRRGKRTDDDDVPPTKTNAHDAKSEEVRQRNVKT
ncbi:basigin-like [Tubulanus polymorphus]|uniref:basigin-like n=1 Tax=Tubulanus polymorphus TaxID=672921 RepID=UPI003DA326D0